MCSNPTQLCRNLRSSKVTAAENRNHRLRILFCTRPVYQFCTHCLVYKMCVEERAGLGKPSSRWIGGGGRKERELLLHHASGSLEVEPVISFFWVKNFFDYVGNRTRATVSASQAVTNSSKIHMLKLTQRYQLEVSVLVNKL